MVKSTSASLLALLPALASAQKETYGVPNDVDFKYDLLPKARLCEAPCKKMTSVGAYGHSMVEQGLPTDHAALFGKWDGKYKPEEIGVTMCNCPDIRTVRVGPIFSAAGEWHWVNTSTFDQNGEAGKLLFEGDRVKAFVGHLVTAPKDVTETQTISLPPLHPHHIHIVERASDHKGGLNYYQTDFHFWEIHGDFSSGKTYGIGDRSNEGFQKHLPHGYAAPIHVGTKIWLYSVMNDMRTWNPKHAEMSAKEAAEVGGPNQKTHTGLVGQGINLEGDATYEDAVKVAKEVAPKATDDEVYKAFVAADADASVSLDTAEFTNFIPALIAILEAADEEYVADLGTDVSPESKLHGTGDIPYYLEVGFAIESDPDVTDVFKMGTRTPWPCDHMARKYKYDDAFYRVGQPNYPVIMFWTIVMPIAGTLINPIWIHSHHLRTWGGHALLQGTLPNTPEFCDSVGIQKDPLTGEPHTDKWDFHKPISLSYSWHKFLEVPGHPVICKSDPTLATTIQAWTNAADGIKPGTRFDRRTEITCIEGWSFPKGQHITEVWFGVPLFEPEVEVIGQHMDGWFFIAPSEEKVMDWDHGILRPILDDCVNTCGSKPEQRATFPHDTQVKTSSRDIFSMNFYAPYFYEKDFDIITGPVYKLKHTASEAMHSNPLVGVAVVLSLAVVAAAAYRKMRAAKGAEGEFAQL